MQLSCTFETVFARLLRACRICTASDDGRRALASGDSLMVCQQDHARYETTRQVAATLDRAQMNYHVTGTEYQSSAVALLAAYCKAEHHLLHPATRALG
jgi:hypothetical protein